MPEYLAPGVYVEEVSFRSKSIEGVSTTTTGFIGPTRYGPYEELEPELLTSLGEFERIYGDGQPLVFTGEAEPMINYVWQATRAFFEEGGKRLYVVRTFRPADGDSFAAAALELDSPVGSPVEGAITMRARFPGLAGRQTVRFTANLGQNVLTTDLDPALGTAKNVARGLRENDIVFIGQAVATSPPDPTTNLLDGLYYRVREALVPVTNEKTWSFEPDPNLASPPGAKALKDLDPTADQVRLATVTVTVIPTDPTELPSVWTDLPLDPDHAETGTNRPDSLFDVFAKTPPNRAMAYRLPIVVETPAGMNGLTVLSVLNESSKPSLPELGSPLGDLGIFDVLVQEPDPTETIRSFDVVLEGGGDGRRPSATEYEGEADSGKTYKTGLKAFEDLEDISIVAAPGSTYGYDNGYSDQAPTITNLLISHAERMKYRIAVVDSGNEQSLSQVRDFKAKLDSKYAAFYYPWVRVLDPITRREIHLPPSGFVAGIYARNDIERAVYKAPANEVVRLAIGFETLLNKSQQDVLNPEGINAFRFFEGRGYRLWGARTTSSDPEWKYVNLRRYFAYLEHSIDRGTQWAVFEPNGELLWAGVRRTVEDFLLNEWQAGALLGDKPERAFFVKCDRSTMTQNDLDNGRLVCLIGVVALRPAEFVIFRIGQATADSMRRP